MNNPTQENEEVVLKAIQALGHRVTIADVVARSGLSVELTSRLLASIAAKSDSSLQVASDGIVYYCFPSYLYYQFFTRGLRQTLRRGGAILKKSALFLFKISFGLTLLSSVMFIFGVGSLFRTIVLAQANDYDAINRLWREFFALFSNLSQGEFDGGQPEEPVKGGVQSYTFRPFLMNCYALLFGPEDPNTNIADERSQLIAQVIRLNEGVVLAEHLSPYTGALPGDEKTMFQILHKFSGYPVVLEGGHLAYVFPAMESRSDVDTYVHMKELIEEKELSFTGLSGKQIRPVLTLALANIAGAVFFIFLIVGIGGSEVHHLRLFTFFALYGSLFFFIPAVRFFAFKKVNNGIRERNSIARRYEALLGNPDAELTISLEEIESLRRSSQVSSGKEVIYRTDKDYLEQLTDGQVS